MNKSVRLLAVVMIAGIVAAACAPAPTPVPTAAPPTAAPKPTEVPKPPSVPTATTAPAPTKAPEPTKPPAPAAKKELKYGLTLVVSGIDPHIHASSELGIPLTSVYDTLVYMTNDYKFVPGLAESWEVSTDATTYTFKLKKGVKFHDGTPFNAQAVKDNLDRIVNPDTKSGKAVTMLVSYKATEVVDEYTARVRFDKPNVAFLDSVAQVYLGMASPTAFKKWGPNDYQMHQVGTGPFKFVEAEYVPKDTIVIEKNPDYNWGPSIYKHTGPAYLDRVVFKFFPDPPTRAAALETGGAHVMGELPPQDAARLQKDSKYQVIIVPTPGIHLLVFINSTNPPTDDLKVRQALLYATDRKTIVKTLFQDLSPVAFGPWPSYGLGYDKSVEAMYPYDVNKAKALLDEAGWKVGSDGIRVKDGKRLSLETYLQTWGFLLEAGQMLQAQLKQVGVELKPQTVAFPAAITATKEGKHHLAPLSLSGSDPSFLSAFFYSKGGYNWSKVNNPELDKLLDQGDAVFDPAKRIQIYAQVQKIVMDQALVIPIREYTNFNGASAKVKGLVYDSHGWFPYFYDVNLSD